MDTPFSLPTSYLFSSSRNWGRTQAVTIVPQGDALGLAVARGA